MLHVLIYNQYNLTCPFPFEFSVEPGPMNSVEAACGYKQTIYLSIDALREHQQELDILSHYRISIMYKEWEEGNRLQIHPSVQRIRSPGQSCALYLL
jgi:hypothetical protein